jgi:hypothetical protein
MTRTWNIFDTLALAALLMAAPHVAHADERAVDLPAQTAAAPAYVCDLRTTASQCRELLPVAGTQKSLQTMSEGCASMGGTFRAQASCPSEGRIARCTDVAPDPNHLDRLAYTYDAHYYIGGSSGWKPASVRRVCINLMGAYRAD